METNSFSGTRASLMARLQRPQSPAEREAAFAEFFKLYRGLIEDEARKAGVPEADLDDIVQTTVIKVAQKILSFKFQPGTYTFRAWVRKITHSKSVDHHRKMKRAPKASLSISDETSMTAAVERIADPNSVDLAEVCDADLAAALLAEGIRRLEEKVCLDWFLLFRHCIIDGKQPREAGRLMGKKPAWIYLNKFRVLIEWEKISKDVLRIITDQS